MNKYQLTFDDMVTDGIRAFRPGSIVTLPTSGPSDLFVVLSDDDDGVTTARLGGSDSQVTFARGQLRLHPVLWLAPILDVEEHEYEPVPMPKTVDEAAEALAKVMNRPVESLVVSDNHVCLTPSQVGNLLDAEPDPDDEPKNLCGLCGARTAQVGFTACSSCA